MKVQNLPVLNFSVSFIMVNKFVSNFLKKFDRGSIVILNFSNNLVFLINSCDKILNYLHYLMSKSFSSILFDCYHYVDFSLILLDPIWKK